MRKIPSPRRLERNGNKVSPSTLSTRKEWNPMPMMGGFAFWWVFGLIGITLMVMIGWTLARHLYTTHPLGARGGLNAPGGELIDPWLIVRERYAQGLISKKEFDRIVQDLLNIEPPTSR
jgi:uncharacterized membrane protein